MLTNIPGCHSGQAVLAVLGTYRSDGWVCWLLKAAASFTADWLRTGGPGASSPSQFATVQANTVLLSLNCDAAAASATKPGYSAANPDGKLLLQANSAQ